MPRIPFGAAIVNKLTTNFISDPIHIFSVSMRKRSHLLVAQAACISLDMDEQRTKTVLKHTMDPDHNLRFMNRFMKNVRKDHPEIFLGKKRYRIKDVYTLHTHKKASFYSIYFAGLSRKIAEMGHKLESDILLAYAIHYLVDCGTPVHAISFVSAKDFFTRKHRKYEDHLEDSIETGAVNFLSSIQVGLDSGEAGTDYAQEHARTLTRYSSGLYKPLLSSFRLRKMGEVEDISHRVFTRIGNELTPFFGTYYHRS